MTTQEFEIAAKNAVIGIMKQNHGVTVEFKNLQFVWFAHELGYKKCTLYARELGHYYPEVTYNLEDIYLKQSNTCIPRDLMDFHTRN